MRPSTTTTLRASGSSTRCHHGTHLFRLRRPTLLTRPLGRVHSPARMRSWNPGRSLDEQSHTLLTRLQRAHTPLTEMLRCSLAMRTPSALAFGIPRAWHDSFTWRSARERDRPGLPNHSTAPPLLPRLIKRFSSLTLCMSISSRIFLVMLERIMWKISVGIATMRPKAVVFIASAIPRANNF